jgi:hypothetical protein
MRCRLLSRNRMSNRENAAIARRRQMLCPALGRMEIGGALWESHSGRVRHGILLVAVPAETSHTCGCTAWLRRQHAG